MGTSSGSESDGSIGAVVAEHAKHLDDMRLLVDEAGLLTSALKLAEKERDVALRQRGALEDALKKIKVENKDVRRKVKELETAVAERDQRYKVSLICSIIFFSFGTVLFGLALWGQVPTHRHHPPGSARDAAPSRSPY